FLVFRGLLVRVVAPRFAVFAVFRFFAIRAVVPSAFARRQPASASYGGPAAALVEAGSLLLF
ncbi:MAG: hypothetical protein QF681_16695, partial [Vicinamibacterales bacterium]|nr:hypothetical protein [Vicinamibacterales bacterium]